MNIVRSFHKIFRFLGDSSSGCVTSQSDVTEMQEEAAKLSVQ